MKRLILSLLMAVAAVAAAAVFIHITRSGSQEVLRIAHTGSPHLAPLYAAVKRGLFQDVGIKISLRQFGSGTDAGFALLSGKVDAVFLEPSTSFRLINENDNANIKIVGSMNFRFGATLIVRKDLNIRLTDVEGLTIAAASRYCQLLAQFMHDAHRYGVDTNAVTIVYMDFSAMTAALEAGKIDGMLTRASYSLPAQRYGHTLLYQNWDVVPGDACCPAYLAQVEFFLLVKDREPHKVRVLDSVLVGASELSADFQRKAIEEFTQFPPDLLAQKPQIAFYTRLSRELQQELGGWVWRGK